jgi:hypothetical protein
MSFVVKGRIIKIIHDFPELQEVMVEIPGRSNIESAYNYPALFRRVQSGDDVSLNTAAIDLNLGTGGHHFIIPDDSTEGPAHCKGHIMKLRYTPWQFSVLAAEEETSPWHELLKDTVSLSGIPVVIAPLHSMISGIVLGFRAGLNEQTGSDVSRVAYVMSDSAALPLALSNLVRDLKKRGWLHTTITSGHAFGGDLEAVSLPSALQIAKVAAAADLIVVAPGPGNVGTGTSLGFSGIEQAWLIDITVKLGGIPILAPRISAADQRTRHYGLSHHTSTVMKLASQPAWCGLSQHLPVDFAYSVRDTIRSNALNNPHCWLKVRDPEVIALFAQEELETRTMGRSVSQDTVFFQTALSSGFIASYARNNRLFELERIEF